MIICSFCHISFARIIIPDSVKFMNQIPAAHSTDLLYFHWKCSESGVRVCDSKDLQNSLTSWDPQSLAMYTVWGVKR